ncbi:MAG TPA: thiamine biosynthesis protein ThiS [Thermoplasmata archaeon]|nr:thiamine biosynthesis protein ThiS [Thermoplasmata archaeon]
MLTIEIDVARAGRHSVESVTVPEGSLVRDVIRHAHQAPEGSVVLIDGLPVPLDTRLERSVRLLVLPTFSGG